MSMTEEEIEKQAEEYAEKITDIVKARTILPRSELNQRYAGIVQGVLYGFEIGRKEKWHDLRKNPDDLPKEDCETVTLHENGNKNIIKWKHGEWTDAIVIPVIAWCELPQFKDKE